MHIERIDDQPIDAGFFGETRRLTEFITPNALDVQALHQKLTKDVVGTRERIISCWSWVANNVRYVKFVRGKIWINGKSAVQTDLWTMPEITMRTRVGNCAIKSFLLASLLRNELSADQIHCTLGNLHNGSAGGHAWVNVKLGSEDYVMESTTPTAPPLVPAHLAARYEPVHYFNDQQVLAVSGRTQLVPFCACFSTWLSDYLNWAYIQNG